MEKLQEIKEKLYFKDIDDTFCKPLKYHLRDAIIEGLTEITLIEAYPETDLDFVWCTHYAEALPRDDCRKSECSSYESKSGRGACSNRGSLYAHGNEVTFKISDYV